VGIEQPDAAAQLVQVLTLLLLRAPEAQHQRGRSFSRQHTELHHGVILGPRMGPGAGPGCHMCMIV
jgi:hypothetical protein